MEQHPVPQNVTTFQFRLIGDMTIKQFGYLAGGAILAYISYKLPVPFFFSWPLAFVFALGGVGFAFVPVEERPMDIWVMSFIKNIYSPTQFVWSHQVEVEAPKAPAPAPVAPVAAPLAPVSPTAPPLAKQGPASLGKPVSAVLQGIFSPAAAPTTPVIAPTPAAQPRVAPTSHHPTKSPFDWLTHLFEPKPPKLHTQAPVVAIPTPSITGRHLDVSSPPQVTTSAAAAPIAALVEKKKEDLDTKVQEIARALEEKTQTHARILELQKQLTDVLAERDHMREEVATLRTKTPQPIAPPAAQASVQPAATPAASGATSANASHTSTVATPQTNEPSRPTVKIITPEGAVKAGLPRLTTYPNVVTGITRDSDNNLLPGVLVTVRDKDDMPIRALKTNRLGQFAASTPVANGTYLVEIEDPRSRFTFDRIQVTLNGSIVPALEIIAKSQKEVARERLAKEIFGS